jgi:hypothetical protein
MVLAALIFLPHLLKQGGRQLNSVWEAYYSERTAPESRIFIAGFSTEYLGFQNRSGPNFEKGRQTI